ncbi:MAG: hypothetical protein SchgKO_16720 [Schleiferiaceae bacterium]
MAVACQSSSEGENVDKQVKTWKDRMAANYDTVTTLDYGNGKLMLSFSDQWEPKNLYQYKTLTISYLDSLVTELDSGRFDGMAWRHNRSLMKAEDSVNFFLIVESPNDSLKSFRLFAHSPHQWSLSPSTPPLVFKKWGDLDGDGKMEIAGYTQSCTEGEGTDFKAPGLCDEFLRVYEMTDVLERDSTAERALRGETLKDQ